MVEELVSMEPTSPKHISKIPYRQLCLIQTDVYPKILSGLGKIRIIRIGVSYMYRKEPGPSNLSGLEENLDFTHVRIKKSCLH